MCSFDSSQQFLYCGSMFALIREHCNQPLQLPQCGIVHTRVAHALDQIAMTAHHHCANFLIVDSFPIAAFQHGP